MVILTPLLSEGSVESVDDADPTSGEMVVKTGRAEEVETDYRRTQRTGYRPAAAVHPGACRMLRFRLCSVLRL